MATVTAMDADSPLTVAAPCGFRTHFPSAAGHASVVCGKHSMAGSREAPSVREALSVVTSGWGWGPSRTNREAPSVREGAERRDERLGVGPQPN